MFHLESDPRKGVSNRNVWQNDALAGLSMLAFVAGMGAGGG
jgi:hypothetical protein